MTSPPGSAPLDLVFSLVREAKAPSGITSDDLEHFTAYVLNELGATGSWEITVALVDDARLQALHRDFMDVDAPTDIMTFPTGDEGEFPQGGELVISVDHAQTQSEAWGHSPAEEIRFLTIHGLLHLLGWRDEIESDRTRMLERQQTLLERWQTNRRTQDASGG
jgi:probable rRNA maturation factor